LFTEKADHCRETQRINGDHAPEIFLTVMDAKSFAKPVKKWMQVRAARLFEFFVAHSIGKVNTDD